MNSTLREYLLEEKGTAVVLFALALSVLVGFTALVTDLGTVYIHRARISNALDGAVLAGAQELPSDSQAAFAVAEQYARANGLVNGEFSFTVSEDGKTITGTAEQEVEMIFSRALGVNSKEVGGRAAARVGPITGVIGIAPFGVQKSDYDDYKNQEIYDKATLKKGGGDGTKGSFGILRMKDGQGANVYYDHIVDGYQDKVKIDDVFNVEPGNKCGKTRDGIAARINSCHHTPQCNVNSYVPGCPRILIVPLGEYDDGNGQNRTFKVTGFAAILVDSLPGEGNECIVEGDFIDYIVPGTVDDDGEDCGLYGVELKE